MFKTATFALSIIQICVFIAELCFRGLAPVDINPGLGPWHDTMDFMGAKNAYKVLNGDITNFYTDLTPDIEQYIKTRKYSGPQPWRLFTNIFLHSGFIHIILNLSLQLRLALQAEVEWGMWRFIPIYFACGEFSAPPFFSSVPILPNKLTQ